MRARTLISRGAIALGVLTGTLSLCGAPASALIIHPLSGSPFGSFTRPTGIAIDQSSGNVYALNTNGPERVEVFDAAGSRPPAGGAPEQITGAGTPAGSFAINGEPAGVAVDNSCYYQHLSGAACEAADPSNGDVYVTDTRHSVVDKFKRNGANFEYVCQFTGYGFVGTACLKNEPSIEASPSEAGLREPLNVAVDMHGNVYIANYSPGDVFEFNSHGEDVALIASPVGPPQGLAVDAAGDLYLSPYPAGPLDELPFKAPGEFEAPQEITSGVVGVGLDPTSATIYADRSSSVVEFSPLHEKLSEFGSQLGASLDLAVNATTGLVYVGNGAAGQIDVFTKSFVPDVTLAEATDVTASSATIAGTVNPDGAPVSTCEFEAGAAGSFPCVPMPGSGSTATPVGAQLTELLPNTSYSVRLRVSNENGPNTSAVVSFTTLALPPVVNDQPPSATQLSRTGAVLVGTLDTHQSPTVYEFEYGTSSSYGRTTLAAVAGASTGDLPVAQTIAALTPGTTYHFRLVATNQGGTTTGPDETFTTSPAAAPVVVTGPPSDVAPSTATIAGTVDGQGLATTYELQFGTSTSYETRLIGDLHGAGAQTISLDLLYLQPGGTYHYRIVASNEDGTSYGADQVFTTGAYQFVFPTAPPLIAVPTVAFPATAKAVVKQPAKKAKPKKKSKKKSHAKRNAKGGKRG